MSGRPAYDDPDEYIARVGFEGEWRDLWWNRDYLEFLARRLEFSRVRRALDVGCGAGHWTRTVLRLLPDDATIVGIDREEKFLDLARKKADQHGLAARSEFLVASADTLPFADDSFDLVTCQTVLMHVPDVEAVLREMMRVVRPGGLVLAAEPDNQAGGTCHFSSSVPPSIDDRVALFRFRAMIEQGKMALGYGNSSVGALLPGMMQNVGLTQIDAVTNNRCLLLLPPYERNDMKLALKEELSWIRNGVTDVGCTQGDARLFFEAAGGTPADFDELWQCAQRVTQAFADAIADGRFHAGRAYVGYLAYGRKPITDANR